MSDNLHGERHDLRNYHRRQRLRMPGSRSRRSFILRSQGNKGRERNEQTPKKILLRSMGKDGSGKEQGKKKSSKRDKGRGRGENRTR